MYECFGNSVEKLGSPSFHLFRWLKGSACDLRGTQAAYSKKKCKMGYWEVSYLWHQQLIELKDDEVVKSMTVVGRVKTTNNPSRSLMEDAT